MSGGSFEYAYRDTWNFGDAETLLRKLYDMRGTILTAHPDAIPYLNKMALLIERQRDEYLAEGAKIKDLLESIEWCYSGDSGPDDIERALKMLKDKEK